jgi:hypothetical protein
MAAEGLPMRKLREIIRLKLEAKQSGRAIARSCGISASTVHEYGRISLADLRWPLPAELDDDDALERLLFPDERHPVMNRPEPDWARVHQELQQRHVTKMLLWQEYKEATPDGYQYSQFCDLYLKWSRPRACVVEGKRLGDVIQGMAGKARARGSADVVFWERAEESPSPPSGVEEPITSWWPFSVGKRSPCSRKRYSRKFPVRVNMSTVHASTRPRPSPRRRGHAAAPGCPRCARQRAR